MSSSDFRKYLLSSVARAPADVPSASAAVSAPLATAPAGGLQAPAGSDPAASAASPAAAATPEAAPAAEAAPKSTPSLLAAAHAKLPDAPAAPAAVVKASPDAGVADAPSADAKPVTDPAADPAKPVDKPAAEVKPEVKEAAPVKEALAEKPQARTYEAFKVPDGVSLAQKETQEFTAVLDDDKLSPQERGQKLVDLYVREAQRLVKEQSVHQRKVWNQFTEQLKTDLKSDPDLGGNREQTTLGIAKAVLEQLGGSKAQVSDTLAMLDHSGMSNYVGVIRLLNNVYDKFMRPPAPLPGNPPSRGARGSFQDVMYGPGANGAGS